MKAVILTVALLSSFPVAALAAKVIVDVQNIADVEGDIKVVLYNEQTFLTETPSYRERGPAVVGDVKVTFENVPDGNWAVLAFHDSNLDDDLNLNFLGLPTEQFGFSNNPGYNHRPTFNESKFTVDQVDAYLDVKLSK